MGALVDEAGMGPFEQLLGLLRCEVIFHVKEMVKGNSLKLGLDAVEFVQRKVDLRVVAVALPDRTGQACAGRRQFFAQPTPLGLEMLFKRTQLGRLRRRSLQLLVQPLMEIRFSARPGVGMILAFVQSKRHKGCQRRRQDGAADGQNPRRTSCFHRGARTNGLISDRS